MIFLSIFAAVCLWFAAAFGHGTSGHEWIHEYEQRTNTSCCNRPAECHDHIVVEEHNDGSFTVHTDTGQKFFVTREQVKPSEDGKPWACYSGSTLYCFFYPSRGA